MQSSLEDIISQLSSPPRTSSSTTNTATTTTTTYTTSSSAGDKKEQILENSDVSPSRSYAPLLSTTSLPHQPFSPTSPAAASFDYAIYVLTNPLGYTGLAKNRPSREVGICVCVMFLWPHLTLYFYGTDTPIRVSSSSCEGGSFLHRLDMCCVVDVH